MVFLIVFINYQVEKLSTRDIEKYLFKFLNDKNENDNFNPDIVIDINDENKKQDNSDNKEEEDKDDKSILQNSEENNTPKERALPIVTAANTKFYIASCIYNMAPKL